MILDIFSRYVVGWMIASRETADLAQRLIRETVEKQGVAQNQLIIHSDRGPSMKSHGVAQLLGALASRNRTAVRTSPMTIRFRKASSRRSSIDLTSPAVLALSKTRTHSAESSSLGITTNITTGGLAY